MYLGQLECYEKCEEIIEKTNGIAIGHTQIQRVVDVYGKELAPTISGTRTLSPVQAKEVLYAEVDGSMLFTRDEGWKEVKVGRIFKSSDCIDPNGEASWIRHSQYLSYIENSRFFTAKMEDLLASYGTIKERLVFINDGATWIRQWIEDAYPDAISILDFYHAMEHLNLFAKDFFGDEAKSKKWTATQKDLLLNSKAKQVIKNIKKIAPQNDEAKKLIAYYETNSERMDYQKYQQIGAGIIGSGAIESAHRTVIQKRMKLSGQRWSIKGAQHMLNIRVTYMNEKWENVINLVKTDFKKHPLKPTG